VIVFGELLYIFHEFLEGDLVYERGAYLFNPGGFKFEPRASAGEPVLTPEGQGGQLFEREPFPNHAKALPPRIPPFRNACQCLAEFFAPTLNTRFRLKRRRSSTITIGWAGRFQYLPDPGGG
jgi:hypothetical protein